MKEGEEVKQRIFIVHFVNDSQQTFNLKIMVNEMY